MRQLSIVTLATLLLGAALPLASGCFRERDYSICNSQAPCKAGFVCTADSRCVPATDGSAGAGGGGGGGGRPDGGDGGPADGSDAKIGCDGRTDCTDPAKPACDTPTRTCVGCLASTDCADPAMPVCDTIAKACVACLADGDCKAAMAPICDTVAHACMKCSASAQCRAKDSTKPACDTSIGACFVCATKDDCAAPTPACDTAAHACVGCVGSGDCAGTTPVCDTTAQSCVQCLVAGDCKVATAPICDAKACRACKADADCVAAFGADPGVCMPDGHCATAGEVVYAVAPPVGSCGTADGTITKPYCTAQAALDQAKVGTKPIVVLRGGFGNISASATATKVTVVGQAGAMINPGANIYGIDASGTANLFVRDLTITGGTSTGGAAAHVAGTGAALTLWNVQIGGNAGAGVVAEGGALITMNRCVVKGGGFGAPAALKTTASPFHVTNCVFANSSFGASLDVPPTGGDQVFKNNTLVADGTGLGCAGALTASGLLSSGNTNDTFGPCAVASCCGPGDPLLTADYHLEAGSPCIDQLTPDSQVTDDIDGNMRPHGAKSDCGADEFTGP